MNSSIKDAHKRKAGEDRRREDKGPPSGWSERRRSVERRKPDVQEISFTEWIAYTREKSCEVK